MKRKNYYGKHYRIITHVNCMSTLLSVEIINITLRGVN